MSLFILFFNEWGWDEGEENHGKILGAFTTKSEAEKHQVDAKKKNHHGDYNIIMIEVGKYYEYGCY